MALSAKITEELKAAMKAKDQGRLRALRAIKSALLLAEREEGGSRETSEDQELKLLQKLAKQRKDSIEVYEEQNRPELAEQEKEELVVIESFLPEQMNDEELEDKIRGIIVETGAKDASDMGKVMGVATKQFAGRADNKKISQIVREILTGN